MERVEIIYKVYPRVYMVYMGIPRVYGGRAALCLMTTPSWVDMGKVAVPDGASANFPLT